jgi:uncharacterized protein
MNNYLRKDISTIFVMLGHECNLQCKYCLQHDVVNVALDKQINPDVYNFICETARSQYSPLQIQFYGGEPLVFWNKIVEIVNEINGRNTGGNIHFSMISNGKLMDEEKVKFINENNIGVCISWDGRNSKITRGYNVFEENKENIFKLNSFSISGVMSSYNYIKDYLEDAIELNRDYVQNYNGHTIHVNVDDLLDINLPNPDLKDFDFNKVYEQMEELCEEYYNYVKNKTTLDVIKVTYFEEKIRHIRAAINSKHYQPLRDRCGNGCEVINMDLKGNLYKCHNTDAKVGTIYDNGFDVLKRVFDMDMVNHTSKTCNECPVQIMCMNGCPLVKDEPREEFYCTMINLMNYPIMKLVTRLSDE